MKKKIKIYQDHFRRVESRYRKKIKWLKEEEWPSKPKSVIFFAKTALRTARQNQTLALQINEITHSRRDNKHQRETGTEEH